MKTNNSSRFWAALTIFSLTGQVAWVVENMYFNVFLYKMFHAAAADLSLMIAASAITAAVTTLGIGVWSDRIGRRKIFMTAGYILWGLSILSFALIRTDLIEKWIPATVSAASVGVSLVIIMDCVMTFFGSSANDAAFNAWLTDASVGPRRGAAEGINAMMPLVAILVVFGGFQFFDLDRAESWGWIYLLIGAAVILIGTLGIFLIEDVPVQQEPRPSFRDVFYGFYPSVVRAHPLLYLTLASFAVFGISIQIFMPYLILYYTETLHLEQYVLIMAPAIVIASGITAFYGKVYDRRHFRIAIIPTILVLMAGYAVLFLFSDTVPVFIGSLLMMTGYLTGTAVFGAMIRDQIPTGKAGTFQGVRICAQVLVPGILGPYIGAWVLSDAEQVVNTDGTTSFVPNRWIFLAAFAVCSLLWAVLVLTFRRLKPAQPKSPYANVSPLADTPWAEYPRPQLRRASYLSLNGAWDFAITRGQANPTQWELIRVPFPPESALSGLQRPCRQGDMLTYRRSFSLPEGFVQGRVLLHFGAVDQCCQVLLNGQSVGSHRGGYLSFTVDITDFLQAENNLTVQVTDGTDSFYPYGKQRLKRGGMWYTPISGIWQSVWLESVPDNYIHSVRFTPSEAAVTVQVDGGQSEREITVHAPDGDFTAQMNGNSIRIPISAPRLWSPEDPYLYRVTIVSGADRVESYFALRTIRCGVVDGIPRILLNGHPYFFHGLLDQGYTHDGIFLPDEPEKYRTELSQLREMGFNMMRKHIKIEPELFYYACDTMGMVVFQDMVNSGTYRFVHDTVLPTLGGLHCKDTAHPHHARESERRAFFRSHCADTVSALYNHPCICYWTIFNEGWGQFDADEAYHSLKTQDPTRIVDATSGWFSQQNSDVESLHVYFRPFVMPRKTDRPVVLSEFGGYACKIAGHVWNPDKYFGYRKFSSVEMLEQGIVQLYEREIIPQIPNGLCAAVYTQLSDVEEEVNGLFTYDRKVCKVRPAIMRALADQMKL